MGVIIVAVLLIGIGLFLALAPEATKVVYAPVEITGSAITHVTGIAPESVDVTVDIKQPGFIGVHQAIGDAPGPIIGQSALLAIGSNLYVTIRTIEPIQPTGEYFALMFVDDGDGVFEAGIDLPVMSNGQVVKLKFSLLDFNQSRL